MSLFLMFIFKFIVNFRILKKKKRDGLKDKYKIIEIVLEVLWVWIWIYILEG